MKRIAKSLLVAGTAVALAFTGLAGANGAPAPASARTVAPAVAVGGGGGLASPDIIGGTKAPQTNWAVQLIFVQNGGTYGCSGEAISSSWILTAQHCVDGISSMNVYYSNSTTNRGTPIAADAVYGSPYGDVALVHLTSSHPLGSYPKLASSYSATAGNSGTIYGYGLRANGVSSTGLYQASVSVLGASTDAYGGRAVHVQGVDGASNHGDSGGPLMINGVIVGVCSTGDTADPGADTHARSNYANLTGSRGWIASTSGV